VRRARWTIAHVSSQPIEYRWRGPVDFEEHLAAFYLDACGFRPAPAGLIHLAVHRHDQELA